MQDLTVLLNVLDGERSARFYCDNLGFAIDNRFDHEGRLVWAQLSFRHIRIMINASAGRAARKPRTDPHTYDDVVLYFMVDDAVALQQVLAARGCEPGPVERQAYGVNEFTVRDPDGYELAFGSRVRP